MSRVPSFEELRAEQDELRERAGFLKRAKARRGLQARRQQPSRRRYAWLVAFASALALAAGLFAWRQSPAGPEASTFIVGDAGEQLRAGAFVAAPPDRDLPLRFVDGTRFSLAAGSSARVTSLEAHGAHLVIEKGRAIANVVHRRESHWRVDVGPFQVAVVGTRFDVSWDAATRVLDLRLDEGAVRVSGGLLSEALEVRAGQRLRAFADDGRVELAEPSRERKLATAPEAPVEDVAPPEPSVSPGAPPPAAPSSAPAPWQALAAAGKFREALAAAERAGFEAECGRASGAALLSLGDAARLSGSATRAEQAYTAAHAKLPAGGRASYGLGLVAFDQRGDFGRAARHFESYLREQPSGALRAEATGRLMEAWQRAGRAGEARRVAEQYLARYPQGPQATRAKQLLK